MYVFKCRLYIFVGTDKSNDFDHFAKWAPVRSEITYLGNFGPNRILFGKVVEVVRLIRSHKTVNDGRHNRLAEHGSP